MRRMFGVAVLLAGASVLALAVESSAGVSAGPSAAEPVWSRVLPLPFRYTDAQIAVAPDGDVVVATTTVRWIKTGPRERTARFGLALARFCSDGVRKWLRRFRVRELGAAIIGIETAADGSILVAANSHSTRNHYDFDRVTVTRLTAAGKRVWQRKLETPGATSTAAFAVLPDGTSYLVTNAPPPRMQPRPTFLLVRRLDASGAVRWTRRVLSTWDYPEPTVALTPVVGGGVALVHQRRAATTGFHEEHGDELVVTMLDGRGHFVWERMLNPGGMAWAGGIAQAPSGEIFVSGTTYRSVDGEPPRGNGDLFVARLSAAGAVRDLRTFGGADEDAARSLVVDTDGTIVVAGSTDSPTFHGTLTHGSDDAFVLRVSVDLEVLDVLTLEDGSNEAATSAAGGPDGSVYITVEDAAFHGFDPEYYDSDVSLVRVE